MNFRTRKILRGGCAAVALLSLATWSFACAWDYDTLRMERSRFPEVLELITGKFLRHSPEFYAWRVEDRQRRLAETPDDVRLQDDLAVAYDKLGQHHLAIETALATEAMSPGRYETAANLGTFYIHAGQYDEGLVWIEKALEINPEAHFGRERYQKWVVEYMQQRQLGHPGHLPLADPRPDELNAYYDGSFIIFVSANNQLEWTSDENQKAIQGILGMLRFGNHRSPVLLEVLAECLLFEQKNGDAKLLATRALLQASDVVTDENVRQRYRERARLALMMQTPRNVEVQLPLEKVEQAFQAELADAETWYAELRNAEISWISAGKNPEEEFDRLYDLPPEVLFQPEVSELMPTPPERVLRNLLLLLGFLGVSAAIVVSLLIRQLVRRFSRRRSQPSV